MKNVCLILLRRCSAKRNVRNKQKEKQQSQLQYENIILCKCNLLIFFNLLLFVVRESKKIL